MELASGGQESVPYTSTSQDYRSRSAYMAHIRAGPAGLMNEGFAGLAD